MTDREKLIEILDRFIGDDWYSSEEIADRLLANGVTVREHGRWISVKDRLPESDKYVLVITAGGLFKTARCNFYKNGTAVCWATNDGLGEKAITHWMPLPEAPKDGEA